MRASVAWKILTILLCGIGGGAAAQGTCWYVATTGDDTRTGRDSAHAFATVAQGISACACGDTIVVLHGTYQEKIVAWKECPGTNPITIRGDAGGKPVFTGDPRATHPSAINASGSGFVFKNLEATSPFRDSCNPNFSVISGNGSDMLFDDVLVHLGGYDGIKTTIDCTIPKYAERWTVRNSTIVSNGLRCPSNGDGIDFTGCHDCLIDHCLIEKNNGEQIQIKLEARNVRVNGCVIVGRESAFLIGKPGQSPQCDSTARNADSVTFTRNVIIMRGINSWPFHLADVSHLSITNNTIILDAMPADSNLGFFCLGRCANNWGNESPSAPVVIENNIFANMSRGGLYGGGQYILYDPANTIGAAVQMNYNEYFDLDGTIPTSPDHGAQSFVADPLWCRYPDLLSLSTDSPARDAGDPAAPNDADGSRSDIGALPYTGPCTTGISSTPVSPSILSAHTFPNPASSRSTIALNLPTPSAVRITIRDIVGRAVAQIFSGKLNSGSHALSWTPPSGLHGLVLLVVTAEMITTSQPVLLLK